MSPDAIRTIARAHAVVAWLATAALIVALPRGWRRARHATTIAIDAIVAATLAVASALGVLLEAPYRSRVRQRLFVEAPTLGWLFERKEHLAAGAFLLAWCTLCAAAAARLSPDPERARDLDRAARLAGIAAAALAIAASIASAIVARRAHV